MIRQMSSKCQGFKTFLLIFKQLKIAEMLRQSNIKKSCGHSPFSIFAFLFSMAFYKKNLYEMQQSKYADDMFSKNTYYRFLNNEHYNWRKFLLLLSSKVINIVKKLTKKDRVACLVLDDTVMKRNRSKSVELLSRVFDHSDGLCYRGFIKLSIGWTDGYNYIPTGFSLHASQKQKNVFCGINEDIDKRCNGYKRRLEALKSKPKMALELIKQALEFDIPASYVLMDSWFVHEELIDNIVKIGLDVIGIVKKDSRKYRYNGKLLTLKEIHKLVKDSKRANGDILGSICVATRREGIRVKLVFVRNYNVSNEWLAILTTDTQLSDSEVIRLYGRRWSIEVFFKATKSHLKLGKEFQGRSFDMLIAHTSIVYARFIILEWIRRQENDNKTMGLLFAQVSDEVCDTTYNEALMSLMTLLENVVEQSKDFAIIELIKKQVLQWIGSQANYIKDLFDELRWES